MRFSTALLAGVLATPALATDLSPSDPDGVLAAVTQAGYEAALETDVVGDPIITVSAPIAFEIYFYGCVAARACTDFNLSAEIDLALTADNVNQWNANTLIGKASTNGTRVLFEHYIAVGDTLPQPQFTRTLEQFVEAIDDFAN